MIRRLSYFTILFLVTLSSCGTAPESAAPSTVPEKDGPESASEEERPEDADPNTVSKSAESATVDDELPANHAQERVDSKAEDAAGATSEKSGRAEPDGNAAAGSAVATSAELLPPREPSRQERIDRQVSRILRSLSVEERLGQLIFPAIMKDRAGRSITAVTAEVRELIERVQPGGLILFGPNFTTLEGTRALLDELQTLSEIPLVFAVDQEGGLVSRLTESSQLPATRIPGAATVGAAGSEELARRLGEVIGAELRSLGIVMNLAPVADVNTNPENPVIRDRAYGSDPEKVADIVAAVVEGIQSQGVAAVLKHFPGHGDTYDDTHLSSATVYHDLERLRAVELVPFEAGIAAGARGVMSGHISVPEVLGSEEPATFSSELLNELLREELGFDGLLITDSLSMAALINYYSQEEIVYRALEAGNDVLLRPLYAHRAYDALLAGVASGRVSEEQVDESVRRILRFKFEIGLLDLPAGDEALFRRGSVGGNEIEVLGRPEHRALVEEIVETAGP